MRDRAAAFEADPSFSEDGPLGVDSPSSSRSRFDLPASPSMAEELGGEETRLHEACSGTIAERYEVLDELGRGATGIVLLVRDSRLNGLRALKRLRESSAKLREEFEHEDIAGSAISHPNICQVLHAGADEYGPFLVMEFIEGETLKALVDTGSPFSLAQAFDVARGILRGLECLHGQEPPILHGHLKPANVLISKDGTPKLTDFGLATLDDPRARPSGAPVVAASARAAPGQWTDGAQADQRSDIFSFGRTLHYALTGAYPELETGVELPEVCHRFLQRCLAHDPKQRFATATQALEGLAPLEERLRLLSSAPSDDSDSGECPQCGANNGESRRSCWDCSHPLIEECVHCQWENRSYMRHCGNCQVDLEGWKQMLVHLEEASRHALEADYEAADSSLAAARKNSSQHEDYEALEQEVRERQAHLMRARERIASLLQLERFEEAQDHLRLLLDSAPEDKLALQTCTEIPGRVRERDFRQGLAELLAALDEENLEAASELLERAAALCPAPGDGRLIEARAKRDALRRKHCEDALEQLAQELEQSNWSECRRALGRLLKAEAPKDLLLEQRLRLEAAQALDSLELDAAHETLERIASIESTAERPWLVELRTALRQAQQTDLADLRYVLSASQSPKELKQLAAEIQLADQEFAGVFEKELAELSARCDAKLRGIRLRRLVLQGLLLLVFGALGASWHLARRSQSAATDYLAEWILWIDASERGEPNLGPEPAPNAPWLLGMLPASLASYFHNERFDQLAQELSKAHWEQLTWEETEEYWAEIEGRSSLRRAQAAFRSWEARRLKRMIPREPVLLNKQAPRLRLNGDLQPADILLDHQLLHGSAKGSEPYGFDVSQLKSRLREQTRTLALRIRGASGVEEQAEITILMDHQEPVCEIEQQRLERVGNTWVELEFALKGLAPGEVVKGLRYRKTSEQTNDDSVHWTKCEASDSPIKVTVPAPADFGWLNIHWEVEDDAGNVYKDAAPSTVSSWIEERLLSLAENSDLDSLRELELNLLHGDRGQAAARGSSEILALRRDLPERLMAHTPQLSISITARRLPRSGAAAGVNGAALEASASSSPAKNVTRGDRFLVNGQDLVLRPQLSGALRDQLLIEKFDDGEWINIWDEPSADSGEVSLGAHFDAGGEPLELRVGTPYLRSEAWIQFSVLRDGQAPQVVGGKLWIATATGTAGSEGQGQAAAQLAVPSSAKDLAEQELASHDEWTLPFGSYVLELTLEQDEPLEAVRNLDPNSTVGVELVGGRVRAALTCAGDSSQPSQVQLNLELLDYAGNRTTWNKTVRFEESMPVIKAAALYQPAGSRPSQRLEYISSRIREGLSAQQSSSYPLRPTGSLQLQAGEWTTLSVTFACAPSKATLTFDGKSIESQNPGQKTQEFRFSAPQVPSFDVPLLIHVEARDPFGMQGARSLTYTLSFPTG